MDENKKNLEITIQERNEIESKIDYYTHSLEQLTCNLENLNQITHSLKSKLVETIRNLDNIEMNESKVYYFREQDDLLSQVQTVTMLSMFPPTGIKPKK